MKIKLICVGKIKEPHLKKTQDEYVKMLQRFCKVQIIELNDISIPPNASQSIEKEILKKESQNIIKYTAGYMLGLAIEGQSMSSEQFAAYLKELMVKGQSEICFIIGGSLGLYEETKQECDKLISMSEMTFPHRLARIILLEQIYRAFKINNNEIYHK